MSVQEVQNFFGGTQKQESESAYKKIPVITNFTDEDGNDRMKETVSDNFNERIEQKIFHCEIVVDAEKVKRDE